VDTGHKKLVSDSGVLQQLTKVPAVIDKLAAAHVLDPTAAAFGPRAIRDNGAFLKC
jgi:hypothetical protein